MPPACQFGGQPKPFAAGIQKWVDENALPLEILTLVLPKMLGSTLGIGLSLLDVDALCAENPEVPEPFTAFDLLVLGGAPLTNVPVVNSATIDKVWRWIRYSEFLLNCDCAAPPLTPGHNCTVAPPSFPLGSLGSVSPAFPVVIDQVVMDAIRTHPGGAWTWFYQGRGTVDGGAVAGQNFDVEYLDVNGVWLDTTIDIATLNANPFCNNADFQAQIPRFGPNTAVRLRNNAGGTHTITNFEFCFCAPAGTPLPLPVQPPITTTPDAPSLTCTTADLCTLVNIVLTRMDRLAAQVSDIQAAVTGVDQFVEIGRLTMNAEGEATLPLLCKAISIELTQLSDEAFTSALGRPRGLMRVGSVRWGDGIGYSFRRFIDADRFDDLRPAGALSLSWQLLPGAQAILKFLG